MITTLIRTRQTPTLSWSCRLRLETPLLSMGIWWVCTHVHGWCVCGQYCIFISILLSINWIRVCNCIMSLLFASLQHSDGFYSGELNGEFGLVPSNFLKEVQGSTPSSPTYTYTTTPTRWSQPAMTHNGNMYVKRV